MMFYKIAFALACFWVRSSAETPEMMEKPPAPLEEKEGQQEGEAADVKVAAHDETETGMLEEDESTGVMEHNDEDAAMLEEGSTEEEMETHQAMEEDHAEA